MFKKLLITLALTYGISTNASALTSSADSYLDQASRAAAYSHFYALRGLYYRNVGYLNLGRSYAVASRNLAYNAYQAALDSYYSYFTTSDYYAQLHTYNVWLYTYRVAQYWNSSPPTAFANARSADLSRSSANGWINYSWGLYGDH